MGKLLVEIDAGDVPVTVAELWVALNDSMLSVSRPLEVRPHVCGSQDMREIHPAAGEWQDIKDAPKYGGGFLLLGWFSDIGFLWTKGYCDEEAESGIPAWRAQQGHRVYPTHFALINPPQDAAIAKGKEEGDAETP